REPRCLGGHHLRSPVGGLESEGAVAVIVVGGLAKEKPTNQFPAFISEKTDIPTIGLPVAQGFAGSDPRIEGDIFHDMLCSTSPTGKLKGHPVAGMGINRYMNACLFAAEIAGLFDPAIQQKVKAYRDELAMAVKEKDSRIQKEGVRGFLK
ncbi:MAG: AIR carboxylase family protein, partial [Bacteroidetes bacterium]|nr:AIR carboxylase family protein [Bacteroidota bacterium]